MSTELTLIDGSGFIFRAFHALPPLSTPAGLPIGAVVGFCNMILKWRQANAPDHWAVVFDLGRSTARTQLFPDYKAHRPAMDPDLVTQVALIKNFCTAMRIPLLEDHGVEADDLIASATKRATNRGWTVVVISSDKDLGQLVSPCVRLYDPMKNRTLDEEDVQAQWGVPAHQIPWVQALAGDSADNIPGIPGIGPKTAVAWIQEFGSLEALLQNPHRLKTPKKQELIRTYGDQARLCLKLAQLDQDAALNLDVADMVFQAPDADALQAFVDDHGLTSLGQRLHKMGMLPASSSDPALATDQGPGQLPYTPSGQPTPEKSGPLDLCQPKPPVLVPVPTPQALQSARQVGYGVLVWPEIDSPYPQDRVVLCWQPGQVALVTPQDVCWLVQNNDWMAIVPSGTAWIGWAQQAGLKAAPFEDLSVLSYSVHGGGPDHSLAGLVQRYGLRPLDGQDKPALDKPTLDKLNLDNQQGLDMMQGLFAQAHDSFLAWQHLHRDLAGHKTTFIYEAIERPLIPVLATMQDTGVALDGTCLRALDKEWQSECSRLEKEIFTLCGHEFSLASPKQLGQVLFERLGWPGGKKGKSGAFRTGSDVLEALALTPAFV
jgi:DNA polymerase I